MRKTTFMLRRAVTMAAFATSSLLAIGAASAAPPVEITHCGQHVNGSAFLTADLDCSAAPDPIEPAITIDARGTLALNGFTVTARDTTNGAVRCSSRCKIEGPGTIVGGAAGLLGYGELRLSVENVTVRDAGYWCIQASNSRVVDSTLTSCGYGGIETTRLYLFNSDVIDNADYGVDVDGPRAVVIGATISGHGISGLDVGQANLRLRYSFIAGNGIDAGCGSTIVCADIASAREPRFEAVFCDHSLATEVCACEPGTPFADANDPLGSNWGFCEAD